MSDPILGAFTWSGLLASVGIIGWIASRRMKKSSILRILLVPLGWASTVWVIVAAAVVIVRVIQLGGWR